MAPHATRPFAGSAALLVLFGLVASGCTTPTGGAYSPAAIRREARLRLADLGNVDVVVPYELDREPIRRARKLLQGYRGATDRTKLLIASLGHPEGFGLRYAWAATSTASETLERGSGNCFALSSVLIGLARGVGLKAYYLEVEIADPDRRYAGDVAVHADHIAAVILTSEGRQYVDFSGRLDRAHQVRAISDLEALAHYYNNLGYELLHRSQAEGTAVSWEEVRRSFEVATRIDPSQVRAWNNLGVARSQLGDPEGAKDAYRQALAQDHQLPSAHVNLAVLHLREGDLEEAALHLQAAEELDPGNPQLDRLRGTLRQKRVTGAADG